MLNSDYRDILQSLNDEKAKFLLIGAYALAAHGHLRTTVDIDVWILPSPDNSQAVLRALQRFGAPTDNLTAEDLQQKDIVFQIGVAPRRIDIITGASGLNFEETYADSIEIDIDGLPVHIPSIDALIRNKKATSRNKDLADIEILESLKHNE
ncbi:MAG TPA: hypothetical protein ENL03_01740 [Phycisphaerae bacterium]|nr:hypothetical protein [Phycisphaerae bacterium]